MKKKYGFIDKFFKAWQDFRKFNTLTDKERSIVFYVEDETSWVHFSPIIKELTKKTQNPICCVTSDPYDSSLEETNPQIIPIYIGDGVLRTIFFKIIDATVMILTMPDLQKFHLKRSNYPVKYVYIFHSMVSTHMNYRKGAFDHYDTIFCVGPHHETEIRATEKLYGLPPKKLIKHGYGVLDSLLEQSHQDIQLPTVYAKNKLRILIAPSWGPCGLLEICGVELINNLLSAGYNVTVRPHPLTRWHYPKQLDVINSRFKHNIEFSYEENICSHESFFSSHLMISDWSGAAMEFAFCLERPILFIDVPQKNNNPEYEKILLSPLEVKLRTQIGRILSPDSIDHADKFIEKIWEERESFGEDIRAARNKWVHNVKSSAEKGSIAILELLSNSKPPMK